MKIIVVRPLDESTDIGRLSHLLSKCGGGDYFFLVIPGRVDFERVNKKRLQEMIDRIPDE